MKDARLGRGEFPTEVLRRKIFGDLIFAETSYSSGQVIDKHSHNEDGFIIVLCGQFLETHENRTRRCKSSDIIFRPAGQLHGNHFESVRTKCFNVQFGNTWLPKLERMTGDALQVSAEYFSDALLFHLGLKLYTEFRTPDVDTPLITEGLTLELIGQAGRLRFGAAAHDCAAWLRKVRDRLHADFAARLTVRQLALEAGVHPVYLNRAFRKYYGKSIGQYVRLLRMQFCCAKLAGSDQTLADISAAAGFCDQGHFSRNFKRWSGVSPLAYRRFFR